MTSPPRRSWKFLDTYVAAYHAGRGLSAAEIAEAIGGSTDARVRAHLSTIGLNCVPRRADEAVIVVKLKDKARDALQALADRRGLELRDFAGSLLNDACNDRSILLNLAQDSE